MSKAISIKLTEQELSTAISSLLFSSSVNVVSNTNKEFQNELFELAKKLKACNPDIQLNDVQFLKEKNYEDSLSESMLQEFGSNLKQIVDFENV